MDDMKKKRGRPRKQGGYRYEAQQKYRKHTYEPKLVIPSEYREVINNLADQNGLSVSRLFVSAVEEKYNVVLHNNADTENNKWKE